MYPLKTSNHSTSGFALVLALSLMAFVVLLLLSITTLVQVESRSASTHMSQMEAEQSALFALNVAFGKLQETVGVDQRVTANASILGDSNNPYTSSVTPATGQGAWMGVWKSGTVAAIGSPDYDPSDPNTRNFVGWLVSGTDGSGNFQLPDALSAPSSDLVTSGRETVTLYKDSKDVPYMQVEKVAIESGTSNNTYFAFSVEDESAKADLTWSEMSAGVASAERIQASRLAAAPGPDYGALNGSAGNGPFTAAVMTYPLTIDDSSSFMASRLTKFVDVSDVGAAISGVNEEWLKDQRPDMTWGSKGVMADVKYGGLRRDLSLAFEMDGDADITATEQPTKFNQQVGEFVGGNDRLAASQVAPGMPVRARYPYRDIKGSGTAFSFDIVEGPVVSTGPKNPYLSSTTVSLRGPTWWLLRDYAQLYKRLEGSSGNYTLDARSYFPNVSQNAQFSGNLGIVGARGSIWDLEGSYDGRQLLNDGDYYIFRPARANYAPVSLGSSSVVSLRAITEDNLAVVLDMFFFFWNPYNHKIACDNLVVAMDAGIPGNVALTINDTVYTQPIANLMRDHVQSASGSRVSFLTKSETGGAIILEPGEVVVATLSNLEGEANLGYTFDTGSGIVMDNINWGTPIASGDDIGYVFTSSDGILGSAGMRNEVQLFLPDGNMTTADLTDINNFGEELQLLHFPHHGSFGEAGFIEYRSPECDRNIPVNTVSIDSLVGVKRVIGVVSTVMKPANWTGPGANPVDVFSRYNPTPIAIARDYNRICGPNQLFNQITGPEPDDLLNNNGISYSTSVRGAYWGASFDSLDGTGSFPLSSIPSSPLISLVSLTHANASVMANEPFHAIGNSWSNPIVPLSTTFGVVEQADGGINSVGITAHDLSWQINYALFDRYYFSGVAPAYSISGAGYSTSETLTEPLERLYEVSGSDYRTANANPVLVPYIPDDKSAQDVVDELDMDDGYLKTGAYSLIDGAFNVNSTSVPAWEAFLRANKDLDIAYSDGGTDSSSGTAFPSSPEPAEGTNTTPYWGGFARLDDTQVRTLAEKIVDQVRLRGPFMSLSDFVNRRVGTPVLAATHNVGALQAAIDEAQINKDAQATSGGIDPIYKDTTVSLFPIAQDVADRTSATGIPGEINQAELLLPLAPRLTARSDTFRVRAYGEVRSIDGQNIVAKALCEAVFQRVPEYYDTTDEPWDEAFDPNTPSVAAANPIDSDINKTLGRRIKMVQFRWLAPDEI